MVGGHVIMTRSRSRRRRESDEDEEYFSPVPVKVIKKETSKSKPKRVHDEAVHRSCQSRSPTPFEAPAVLNNQRPLNEQIVTVVRTSVPLKDVESMRERYKTLINDERRKVKLANMKVEEERKNRREAEKRADEFKGALDYVEKKYQAEQKLLKEVQAEKTKAERVNKILLERQTKLREDQKTIMQKMSELQKQTNLINAIDCSSREHEKDRQLEALNSELRRLEQENKLLKQQNTPARSVCRVCLADHPTVGCPIDPIRRCDLVAISGRCIACLIRHEEGRCRRKAVPCPKCGLTKHHVLLCPDSYAQDNSSTSDESNVVGGEKRKARLKTEVVE